VLFIVWVPESFYRRGLGAWQLVRYFLLETTVLVPCPGVGLSLPPFLSWLFLLLWTTLCPVIRLEQTGNWVLDWTRMNFRAPFGTVSIAYIGHCPLETGMCNFVWFRPLHCIQGHIRKGISQFWHFWACKCPISLLFLRSPLRMCSCMNQLTISSCGTKRCVFALCEMP
jgi:hypothetical protein